MQPILDFGVRLIVALQGFGNWLELPMKFFSFMGTEEFFMVVLPALYWCLDSSLGIRVAVILMISGAFNDALKMAFHGTRPYWYSAQVKGLASETSFGVPSNHAQSATVIWGMLAAYLRKWWAWLAAILLILMIAVSRLYLGVHFPHDVLLGLLLGGLLLWLVLRFWKPVVAWAKKKTFGQQVGIAFLASLVLFLFSLVAFVWLRDAHWQPPQAWADYAAQAISLENASTTAGTFFGLMAGLAWIVHKGGFQTKGLWWQLVLRYFLGVAGVLIIRYGLKFIFPEGETVLAIFFRYVRYMVIGFWVTGGAPWAFIRLKLAEKAR
ncbi:MAG: phosphatase PAP2 family protein [Chloroflexota bacterium]